jgi:outer membrane protein OmpA-like peptidoglycan-associated protein
MFAPKAAKPQTKAAEVLTSKLAPQPSRFVGHGSGHGLVGQALCLQRAIGNQATLRPPAQRTGNLTGNDCSDQREYEAQGLAREISAISWDFSRVPVFPPERTAQPRARSPIAAPPPAVGIQPKLTIGPVDDPLEHEADRVADQLMRMPDPGLSITGAPPQISRKCAACEEEDKKTLLMKPAGTPGAVAGEAPQIVHDVIRSPGYPLDVATRAFFESRFGRDFSGVRVHTGTRAAESAAAVNALAYTVGQDVVFADGRYAPTGTETRRLLAHELAHVLQQNGAMGSRIVQGGDSADVVQRQSPQSTSNVADIPPLPCDLATMSPVPPDVVQESITFPNDASELTTVQMAQIDNFIRNWWAQGGSTPVRVDGFASKTGPTDHNWSLSCWRASNVAAKLKQPLTPELDGIPESLITVFMHGETTEFPSEGENRRATISAKFPPGPTPPSPGPTPPGPSPGPTPPCTPHPIDLTKIPASMDANGLTRGAALLREWFGSPAHVRQKDDRAPVDASTITMDFVLGFDRAKQAFDQIFSSQLFANRAAQREIRSMPSFPQILPTPSDPAKPFDFPRSVTAVDPDFDIQLKVVGSVFDPIDDLTTSLGEFTFRMAVAGSVQVDPATGMFEAVITDVGVHVRDSFDFEGFQLLGCWNVCTNQVGKFAVPDCELVTNGDFRDWRTAHGMGGDFKVLSDLRIVHLPTPVHFTLGG